MDKKDFQVLSVINFDARMPLNSIAKKVNLSPQTTNYRLAQLEKKEIIRKYITFFDPTILGYLPYRVYIRYEDVDIEKENEIITYLTEHKQVMWLVSTMGKWDVEVLILAKNFIHFNNILKEIYRKFPGKLQNNIVSVSIENYHQNKWELEKQQPSYGGEPKNRELDELEKKVCGAINQNARSSNSTIAQKTKMNYKTVQKTLKRLETEKIIQRYRAWLDFKKLGMVYYKILITTRNFSEKDKLKVLEYCKKNKNVIYMVTCVWPWDLELELEAENEEQIQETIREIRLLLKDTIKDYEILHITQEHKLNYLPMY